MSNYGVYGFHPTPSLRRIWISTPPPLRRIWISTPETLTKNCAEDKQKVRIKLYVLKFKVIKIFKKNQQHIIVDSYGQSFDEYY